VSLEDEFNEKILTLRNVHFDDAAGRLIAILDWLESEPVTKRLLDTLTKTIDVAKLFEGAGYHKRPRANTREEIVSVGLQLIRECRERNTEFFNICFVLNIRGAYSSGSFQDANDAGMREYIVPFLEYVEQGLNRAASEYSIAAVADNRLIEVLSEECTRLLPITAANLHRISSDFVRSETEVAWQNIGNSCRQTLIEFAEELRQACGVELPGEIQAGNVKAVLKHICHEIVADGRFKDTLVNLVESVWNHVQSITHRNTTTKPDALRAFFWTGMVVSEFIQPLRSYNEA
jgi:hypothetical protein